MASFQPSHNGREVIRKAEAAEILGIHHNYISRAFVKTGILTNLRPEGVEGVYRDEVENAAAARDGGVADAPENKTAAERYASAQLKQVRATLIKVSRKHNDTAEGLILAHDAQRVTAVCADAWAKHVSGAVPPFLSDIAPAGAAIYKRDIESAVEDMREQVKLAFSGDLMPPDPATRALLDPVSGVSQINDKIADVRARTANTKADTILLEDGAARGVFVDHGDTRRKVQGIAATARNQVTNIRHRIQVYVPVAHRAQITSDIFEMLSAAADKAAKGVKSKDDTAGMAEVFASALRPLEPLSGSEWQNKHRRLDSSVSARPGPMLMELTPYMRLPLDLACGADPSVRQVTFASGAQLSKSETLLLSTVGYFIDRSPAGIVAAYPTEGLAKTFAATRFPALLQTPVLATKVDEVREDKTRKGRAEAMTSRSFSGGNLAIVSAGSVAELSGRPAKLIIADELDRMTGTKEGDPFELLQARSITFPDRMAVVASTPTHIETSRIWKLFLEGSQAHYFVPCDCGHSHVLDFDNLQATDPDNPDNVDSAAYICPSCGEAWDDAQRLKAIDHGEWKEARPDVKAHKSFHLNSLNSPFMTNAELYKKKRNADKGDIETKITFTNLYAGLPWDDSDDASSPEKMAERLRRDAMLHDCSWDSIPPECLVLTAGVDIQQDRIELTLVGWGEPNRADGDGTACWVLGHTVFEGDTSADAVWDDLDYFCKARFQHPLGGEMIISRTCVDTGYNTQNAMKFCAQRPSRYFAIKGSNQFTAPIWAQSKSKPKRGEAKLHLVGVSQMKLALFKSMLQAEPGNEGHVRFADMDQHSPLGIEAFADQMTSEYLFTSFGSKGPVQEWKRRGRVDREILDTMVYASAGRRSMAHIRWNEVRNRLTVRATPAAPTAPAPGQQTTAPAPDPAPNAASKGGWASFE